MIKLSEAHLETLQWLSNGNIVEQCTQPGRTCGNVNAIGEDKPARIITSLNMLIQYGLVDETELERFGIRWSRLRINKKGLKALGVGEVCHVHLH